MRADPKLTYDDYLLIPADGKRHEIVDGDHVVNAAPSPRHQRAVSGIALQLRDLLERTGRGQMYFSPIDVLLSPVDVVQPDVIVILAGREHIITDANIDGVPDLVVEVVSPSSARYDREVKKDRYEAAGVEQYWIADPDDRSIENWQLVDGRYRLAGVERNAIAMIGVDDVVVQLAGVW